MSRVIKLHAEDNVLVALTPVAAGDALAADGCNGNLVARDGIAMAHKLAARPIEKGEAVIKYGMPIGEATEAIPAGAHVHVHNVVSRYTATHYRAEEAGLTDV